MKILVYIQNEKMYVLYDHLEWVGLNNYAKIINNFSLFGSFHY